MAESGTVLKFNWVSIPDREIDVVASKLAYGDLLGEGFAGKKLESSVHGKLLGVAGRRMSADDDLPLNFLDDEVADSPMRQLVNLGLHAFGEGKGRVETVADYHVNLRVASAAK
jgi:hypothetical protein